MSGHLDPPLSIPEEARRHFVIASNIFKEANGPDDFRKAESRFKQAADLAPWWGDTYFNLGELSTKLGDLEEALKCFHLYLTAAPDPEDARLVQDRIYILEEKLGIGK